MRARRWPRWPPLPRPTLVRRLMLAQLLLLTMLWSLFMAFLMIDGADSAGALNGMPIYHALISVADNLEGAPALQQQSLRALERTVRADFETGLMPELAPHFQVWQHGRLVYRTQDSLPLIPGSGRDGIETIYIKGQRWRMRTYNATRSDTRVAMLAPSEVWHFFLTMNSRGFYLLPLVISLPFLLAPAWLSIRMALRPWRRVAQEVAQRGPHDLAPLSFRPPHLELATMVDNINALLARVHQSAQRERSFIADAAHELRTPLAAMRVNVEALSAQTGEPHQRELLAGILSSENRATRLVGQLLLLMRSDAADGGARETMAFDALLEDRLAALSGLAGRRGIDLELVAQRDVAILGQRESLISLIDNLVDNAIKYSPAHGHVTVTLALALEAGVILFTVADQGPGVAPPLRERVFDRFFRDPRQTQGGSGLGLSIARSVVRQHGGTIVLDAAPGGGLLVCVSLPLAWAAAIWPSASVPA